jgi:hypothetical protein
MREPARLFEDYEIMTVAAFTAALGYLLLGQDVSAGSLLFGFSMGICAYHADQRALAPIFEARIQVEQAAPTTVREAA